MLRQIGLHPEVVVSGFAEDLDKSLFTPVCATYVGRQQRLACATTVLPHMRTRTHAGRVCS